VYVSGENAIYGKAMAYECLLCHA